MESAKRIKLDTTPSTSHLNPPAEDEEEPEILKINDDCFDAIFWHLSENRFESLCAFSRTCMRIKNLSQTYFARKYPQKQCEIAQVDGTIKIKKYAEFKETIRNFWFHGNQKHGDRYDRLWSEEFQAKDTDLLRYYLDSQCNKQLKWIRFENMILLDAQGQLMDSVLKTVEAVEFVNCDAHDIHNDILVRCLRLKSLSVLLSNNQCDEVMETWISQQYPHLESLEMHLISISSHEHLERFFELNPQLKRFSCKSPLSNDDDWDDSQPKHVMNAIIEKALRLEELSLIIGGKCDFANVFPKLLIISERQQFQRLHLEFCSADAKEILIFNLYNLASLKLHALHINNIDFVNDFPDENIELSSIKELHLKNLSNCEHSANIMSRIMPNLELLVIRNSSSFTPGVVGFIQPFIANLPKLRKIVVAQDVMQNISQRLGELNKRRQELVNACTVHIWTYPPKRAFCSIEIENAFIQLNMIFDEYEHFSRDNKVIEPIVVQQPPNNHSFLDEDDWLERRLRERYPERFRNQRFPHRPHFY